MAKKDRETPDRPAAPANDADLDIVPDSCANGQQAGQDNGRDDGPGAVNEEGEEVEKGVAGEVESVIKALLDELAAAGEEKERYLNIAQRTQADFDNYRRRNEQIGAARYQDGVADALEAMLPVVDNFERAINSVEENDGNRGVLEGVRMVHKQLMSVFMAKGCAAMDTPKGTVFDPNLHNAVMTVPCPEGETPGTIADCYQTGYMLNGKVLRHASVRVFQ